MARVHAARHPGDHRRHGHRVRGDRPVSGTERFVFTPENDAKARAIIGKYPPGRQASGAAAADARAGAVRRLAAAAGARLRRGLSRHAADPRLRGRSFYDMFNTRPVGRVQIRVHHHAVLAVRFGRRGARVPDVLGIKLGESTPDMRFFLREFECLGACANAPMMWIDDDYYEDLTYDSARAIIEALRRGERPEPGSQTGRRASMPAGGKTSLFRIPTARRQGHQRGSWQARRRAGTQGAAGEAGQGARREDREDGRPAHDIGDRGLAEPKDPDAR